MRYSSFFFALVISLSIWTAINSFAPLNFAVPPSSSFFCWGNVLSLKGNMRSGDSQNTYNKYGCWVTVTDDYSEWWHMNWGSELSCWSNVIIRIIWFSHGIIWSTVVWTSLKYNRRCLYASTIPILVIVMAKPALYIKTRVQQPSNERALHIKCISTVR